MSDLVTLCRYKRWANERLYRALDGLPDAELHALRPIIFGSIARTLAHVLDMDRVWQAHLLGRTHDVRSRVPAADPDVALLSTRQAELDAWYLDRAGQADRAWLDTEIAFRFIDGGAGSMRRRDMLAHVVNHGTYHRGHIAMMMYQAGAEPPVTDFPVFLRDTG